ncbi:MAG: amidohydrolase, partial [Gammaproteobacteria bacterium]
MSVSFRLLIAAKLGALSFAGATVVAEPADLVILGNGIYTMRTASPWAEGVAVRNGTIVFVGDREGAQSLVGTGTRVIELGARMVLPGFQDSHIHPMSGGMRLLDCRFHGLAWPDEVHARIRDCVAELENGEWLRGVGLAEEIFDGVGPSREQLDALTGGHPAYLRTVDGFNLWVNSRAFVLAGIDASTPDPPYGRIERKADGAPSGTLRQSATGLVYRHVPQPSTDKYREALRRATAIANRFGITS